MVVSAETLNRWEPSTGMRACRDGVARAFGLEPHYLPSATQIALVVRVRFAAAWVLRQRYPRLSHAQLGKVMGGRNHQTMIHALRRAAIFRARDPEFRALTDALASAGAIDPEAVNRRQLEMAQQIPVALQDAARARAANQRFRDRMARVAAQSAELRA